jgi:hypothetical protein
MELKAMIRSVLSQAALAAFFLPQVSGAIFHEMDTTVPLECTLSAVHQNRILIEGGRVRKVVHPDGVLTCQMEPESGQAFVRANGWLPHPVTLSVVTDTGVVQDIQITLEDCSSQVVILREPSEVYVTSGVVGNNAEDFVVGNLEAVLSGGTPSGYVKTLSEETREGTIPQVVAQCSRAFTGPYEEIRSFEVTNQSEETRSIVEENFIRPGDLWVHLTSTEIAPEQVVQLVVGVGR